MIYRFMTFDEPVWLCVCEAQLNVMKQLTKPNSLASASRNIFYKKNTLTKLETYGLFLKTELHSILKYALRYSRGEQTFSTEVQKATLKNLLLLGATYITFVYFSSFTFQNMN